MDSATDGLNPFLGTAPFSTQAALRITWSRPQHNLGILGFDHKFESPNKEIKSQVGSISFSRIS